MLNILKAYKDAIMKNIILGIGIGFVVTSLLINAEPPNNGLTELEKNILLEELLKDAAEDYGQPLPKQSDKLYPKMQITSQEMVEWVICKNTGCNATAAAAEHFVFISDTIDLRTPEGQGVAYHELIHVLQYIRYGTAPTCREWVRREEEAYRLQDAWVSARGVNNDWIKTGVYKVLNKYCLDYSTPKKN